MRVRTMKDGLIGMTGCVLAAIGVRDEVSAWTSLICSVAIAVVTCGIQIWRMIRDRNSDKEEKKKDEKKDDEK